MSGFTIGAMVVMTALTTFVSLNAQKKVADNQIEQGRLDKIASDSSTKQAEMDALDEQSMQLTDALRESLSAQSTAVAIQANTGISGVTAERQRSNIDFQNTMDVNRIQEAGDRSLISIRNAGFSNASKIQSSINSAQANRPSGTTMATTMAVNMLATGVSAYGQYKLSGGGKSTKKDDPTTTPVEGGK